MCFVTDSEDSSLKTQAEAQNGSGSSGSGEIPTDDEKIEDTADQSRSIDDNLTNESPIKAASLINSCQNEKSDQSIEEINPQKTTPSNVKKTDIATSPINFELSENISDNVNLLKSNEENTLKTSIALSPINKQVSNVPTVSSTSAQTEIIGSKFFDDNKGDIHVDNSKNDSMNLLPPQTKLVSTPMENVLKLSFDPIEENSLSLQTKSSNQTMNLTVQLPSFSLKSNNNKHPFQLAEIQEKHIESVPSTSQIHDLTTKMDRNLNISKKDNKPTSSKHDCDHVNPPCLHTFNKTVKEIIEPTVSEVLKQIHDAKTTSASAQNLDEVDNRGTTNSSKRSELTKPNIFLQTKHNLWKKCEDYPVSSFIDLESPKQTMDSSNQTEAEKQNVHVQVAESLAGSVSEKGISAPKLDNVAFDFATSYLTMMQPPPPPSETVISSVSYSSTHPSSSSASSSSTSSSKSKDDLSVHMVCIVSSIGFSMVEWLVSRF